METNYNYTQVPTNLMLQLDCKLQSVLFNLIQLSNVFSDKDGYFYRSNQNLQKAFGLSKHPTIAAIETLYRLGIVSVKSIGYQSGKRRTNYYRVNFEKFSEYDKLELHELYNIPEHIKILNYNSKEFKATYLDSEKASTALSKSLTLTTIHQDDKNVSEGLKSALIETSAIVTATANIERRSFTSQSERKEKILNGANILLTKLRKVRKWNEYQEKIQLYEDWLNKCCSTLTNGEDLKRDLYHQALHIMDSITFDEDVPKIDTAVLPNVDEDDDDWEDCPLTKEERREFGITVNPHKLYKYCGNDKGEMITIGEAIELDYNLRLLYDTEKHTYYCPPSYN